MNKIISLIKVKAPIRKKPTVPVSLRTYRDEAEYGRAKLAGKTKRPLHLEERLREWKYWALIDNEFPYTAAFKVHHMLIPKRVTTQQGLKAVERRELEAILRELSSGYDCHLTNYIKKQSIHNHFHIHMLVYKDTRGDMSF